jgi:hypothetical protein
LIQFMVMGQVRVVRATTKSCYKYKMEFEHQRSQSTNPSLLKTKVYF